MVWGLGRDARTALVAVLAAALVPSPSARAQTRNEQLYGTPVDVTISDLVQNGTAYEGRAVRTKGRLDLDTQPGARLYMLRDGFGSAVRILPTSEVAGNFESEGLSFLGQELEITGVFSERGSSSFDPSRGNQARGVIQFWQYLGPPEKLKGPITGTATTLEALVGTPGKRDGQQVKVVGKFRGKNLYGDLPSRSERNPSDWVIKDDVYAVWVTGKKPKGSGWELDTGLKRDTGKWVEVIGRPETVKGVTYIRALQVTLASPPSATATAQPPPPPPERPKVPPVVVFTMPLDGEADLTEDTKFLVQFSKDMDEQTFKGRVVLRYAGPIQPGDRPFDGLKVRYDNGHKALSIEPGDLLKRGRQVEIVFLPGIADVDGLPLGPRPGKDTGDAADVLRFRVAL